MGPGCFRRLSYSPTSEACAPECRHPQTSPGWLTPSRVVLTPSAVVPVRPLRAAPERDWPPAFVCGQGDSGCPETRFRVAQSQALAASDWVESRGVSPGSARCNRTSPITGIRLRAMRQVTVGGRHLKDGYRSSGCVGAHPCPPESGGSRGCGGIRVSIAFPLGPAKYRHVIRSSGLPFIPCYGISSSVLRTWRGSPEAHCAFGACPRPGLPPYIRPADHPASRILRKGCLYFLSPFR